MRVLVIGASGYYGTQVVRSLQQIDGIEVLRGRRKGGDGWIQIDLADISTYSAFEQADLILNCADTVGAPSDQAVLFCLKHGHTFFEMGADTPTLQRLLRLPIPTDSTGRAVIGVGIFPGLSTVLAHHASQQVEDCQCLDFAVRISPFSGAGKANCTLMAKMLAEPAIRYHERRWVEGPAVGETLHVPFANIGLCPAVQVGLPDTVLIHETTPATHIASFIALQPAIMRHNFRFLAWTIAHAGPLKNLFVRLSEWSLRFLRAFLLRNTSSHLALTVIANRGLPDQKAFSLSLQDGQRSTATATAAAVALWKERHALPPPGIYTPPALFALEPMLQQMRQLGHPELHLS